MVQAKESGSGGALIISKMNHKQNNSMGKRVFSSSKNKALQVSNLSLTLFLICVVVLSCSLYVFISGEQQLPAFLTGMLVSTPQFENENVILQFTDQAIDSLSLAENIDDQISTGIGTITIDTTQYPGLNHPAKITFLNVCYDNPYVLYNGIVQPSIQPVKVGECQYQIEVPHFSTWSLSDTTWGGTHNNTQVYTSNLLGLSDDAYLIFNFNTTQNRSSLLVSDLSINGINGSLQPTYESGRIDENDSSMFFDGVNDILETNGDIQKLYNQNWSLSMWIYPKSNNTNFALFADAKGTSGNEPVYGLLIYASNQLRFNTVNISQDNLVSTSPIPTNQWTHIVIVYNWSGTNDINSSKAIFINGVFNNGSVINKSQIPSIDYAGLKFGRYRNSLNYNYNGLLDEIKIWNRTITADEVYHIYLNESNKALANYSDKMIAEWRFNNSESILADDSFDKNHLVLINYSRPLWNSTGGINTSGAFMFNGLYNYIRINNTHSDKIINQSNSTLSVWFKMNRTSSQVFAAWYNFGNIRYAEARTSTGGTEIGCQWNATIQNSTSSARYYNNEWHMIACIREGQNVKLYLDGVLNGTTAFVGDVPLPPYDLFIGAGGYDPSATYSFFNGSIDEVKLFRRALTADDIWEMYSNATANLNKYYKTGNYISEIYNTSDLDPTNGNNLWQTATFLPNSTIINSAVGRTDNCSNITSASWVAATTNQSNYTFGLSGPCFQYQLFLQGDTGSNNTLENVTFSSQRARTPTAINIWISNTSVYVNDTVYGRATFQLNDTDTGNLAFTWYINGIQNKTETYSGLSNGTTVNVNLTFGIFNSNDNIYFTVLPSTNITHGNATGTMIYSSNVSIIPSTVIYWTKTYNNHTNKAHTFFTLNETVKIKLKIKYSDSLSIKNSTGSIIVSNVTLTNETNIFNNIGTYYYHFVPNQTGWYSIIGGLQEESEIFYVAAPWQSNWTDSNSN